MNRVAALLLALSFAGFAHAQVFKCVDSSGKTVYSQSPCPTGAKSKTISSSPPPASASAPADKKGAPLTQAERDQEARKKAQEKTAEDKKAADAAARETQLAENCKRAREQLAGYEAGGRISRINAQGERYYLSEEEIAREKGSAQAAVGQNCK